LHDRRAPLHRRRLRASLRPVTPNIIP
jgi:hypothetical protein